MRRTIALCLLLLNAIAQPGAAAERQAAHAPTVQAPMPQVPEVQAPALPAPALQVPTLPWPTFLVPTLQLPTVAAPPVPASTVQAIRARIAEERVAIEALIVQHAKTHSLPEALVRLVVRRESNFNPRAIYRGNYGLMQIRLGTARALGYRGDADGLLDPATNMTYAMPYLAGAYRAAHGDEARTLVLYSRGYHDVH
jgi:soluble lytic murein transglycosylase-like protein